MTIEETVEKFIEDVNAEFGSDLALAIGDEGEIAINWPGHGHIYIDSKTGEILPKTKLTGGLVDKLREALAPKPKADPRPTVRQAAEGIARIAKGISPFALAVPATIRDVQVAELTLDDIRGYICKDATDQEAFMFLKLCQARNLNPFTNEAYLVKYGSKATMIVGKEAFMRKAELHPQYKGFKAGVIVDDGEGSLIYREGSFVRKGEELLGGWAEVFRKDRDHPVRAEVALKDYERNDSPSWKNHKATMIRKVPLVQAMREAFPSDLAGCYDSSEFRDAIDVEGEVVS